MLALFSQKKNSRGIAELRRPRVDGRGGSCDIIIPPSVTAEICSVAIVVSLVVVVCSFAIPSPSFSIG